MLPYYMAPKGRQKKKECQITCHLGFSVYSLTVWEDSESEKRKKRKRLPKDLSLGAIYMV